MHKLVEVGLQVSVSGRDRYYTLASDAIGVASEGFARLGRPRVITAGQSTRVTAPSPRGFATLAADLIINQTANRRVSEVSARPRPTGNGLTDPT